MLDSIYSPRVTYWDRECLLVYSFISGKGFQNSEENTINHALLYARIMEGVPLSLGVDQDNST